MSDSRDYYDLIQTGFKGKDPGVIHVRTWTEVKHSYIQPKILGSKAMCGHVFDEPMRSMRLEIELLTTDVDVMKNTCPGCMDEYKTVEFLAV